MYNSFVFYGNNMHNSPNAVNAVKMLKKKV